MALTPGTRLGAYEITAQIGVGGMGEVYRARDTRLGRDVAIKVLPYKFADDPDRLRRFELEARAIAALNHPHICQIYDVGPGYLVLEYITGKPISGPLPVREAVRLSLQIADALGEAHAHGLLHRDLKPANVLLTEKGTAKLLDFGLAKLLESARVEHDEVTRTIEGAVQGTPSYMSPEQAQGRPLDARSDVFSFGAVLYELLSGTRAFDGESHAQVLSALLRDDPTPLNVPAALERVVRRCLAKDPNQRFSTILEVKSALEQIEQVPADVRPSITVLPRVIDLKQEIRFCTAPDGVQLAYSRIGQGPPLMKTGNWMTHLEFDLQSPIWRHLYQELAKDHTLVRYDARGNGLSDRTVDEISFDAFVSDLETVVDTAGLTRFALLGISQGCAVSIAYAVRHPERVSHLILYGGYALGSGKRARTAAEKELDAAYLTLIRAGWGQEHAEFRQLFTSQFIPGATKEQADWFNELQRISVSPEVAARLREVNNQNDVTALLPQLTVPTLVLHARDDARVPFEAGRRMAAGIPGARFVTLQGCNHLFLETEPAFAQFLEHTRAFLAT